MISEKELRVEEWLLGECRPKDRNVSIEYKDLEKCDYEIDRYNN